ncbi:MAG: 3-isopropylmalate dehydratase large subunit [Oscillospiraceae bacterium]|jgi:3-isopropylmalate/(R)-2-methylmalate dehydratase large subunit|nr:3-isopropylmalate dehydratase large subunit [Oscillospiraceae bacterium]
MGMTMTQKILADHAGLESVTEGQLINAKLDLMLSNDITAPVAIRELEKAGVTSVFDANRVVFVNDHFVPNKDIKAAQQAKTVRDFANKHNVEAFYDTGTMGIEHCLLPEQGLAVPGDCIIGADSHTCTYGALGAFATGVGSTDLAFGIATGMAWFKVPSAIKINLTGELTGYASGKDLILHLIGMIGVDGARYKSLEFAGDNLSSLSMDDRLTIANMAIEAGAKNGIFPVDSVTRNYCEGRIKRPMQVFEADSDAVYEQTYTIDLGSLRPTVAFPHLPENTRTIDEIPAGSVEIQQSVIGSCTNGRLSDLRIAAQLMKGKKVAKNVRCIVFPGTQQIYLDALREGLIEIFIEAGAAVSTPTCGPCLGGHMGILAEGERAVSTTNRNFVGRMGHKDSEVYLASPAVAAASAVAGYIANPEEIGGEK